MSVELHAIFHAGLLKEDAILPLSHRAPGAPTGPADARLVHRSVDAKREELVAFLQGLVRTPSLPGQEHAAHHYVASQLRGMGLDVEIVPCDVAKLRDHPAYSDDGLWEGGPRINVVARWAGAKRLGATANGARSLILNGHLDVVSPGDESHWKTPPWSGDVRAGRLFGRGSCDMKAGVTAGVFAIAALQSVGFTPAAEVILETVSGEESGGIGTLSTVVHGVTADAAIVLEPTSLQICPVQSGALTFRLRIPGRSVHACMRNRGVSAIDKATYLLHAINELHDRRHEHGHHALYADPSNVAPISVGTIRGGDWHSTVPNEVIIEGRYGIFPGESVSAAKAVFARAIEQSARADEWLCAHPPALEWFEGQFESAATALDEPLLGVIAASHRALVGEDPTIGGVTYGSDLRFFTNYLEIPAVLYGPGDVSDAHTVDESVDLEEVVTATKVLASTIWNWCERSGA